MLSWFLIHLLALLSGGALGYCLVRKCPAKRF